MHAHYVHIILTFYATSEIHIVCEYIYLYVIFRVGYNKQKAMDDKTFFFVQSSMKRNCHFVLWIVWYAGCIYHQTDNNEIVIR